MEEDQVINKEEIQSIVIYAIRVFEMVIDFSLKAIGIYYMFYKLDPVNGAIILASSSLLTISVILANTLPKMTKEPRIFIQLPEKIVVEKKEEKL